MKTIAALALALLLAGCGTTGNSLGGLFGASTAPTLDAEVQDILAKAASLHQLTMGLAALQQAPVAVMMPMPAIVTPSPTGGSPTVTPMQPPPVAAPKPVPVPSQSLRNHAERDPRQWPTWEQLAEQQ